MAASWIKNTLQLDKHKNNNDSKKDAKVFKVDELLLQFPTKKAFSFRNEDDYKMKLVALDLPKQIHGYTINNVLSLNECNEFIRISEQMGYKESPLTVLSGNFNKARINEQTKSIRNSLRVLCEIPNEMNDKICQRILPFLPKVLLFDNVKWNIFNQQCINPRWRFNKYLKGQYFKPHYDAGYSWNKNKKCSMTLIIYLNDAFIGGETIFYPHGNGKNSKKIIEVKPEIGKALIFIQRGWFNPLHEGAPHESDGMYKYIIRSDLVYTKEC